MIGWNCPIHRDINQPKNQEERLLFLIPSLIPSMQVWSHYEVNSRQQSTSSLCRYQGRRPPPMVWLPESVLTSKSPCVPISGLLTAQTLQRTVSLQSFHFPCIFCEINANWHTILLQTLPRPYQSGCFTRWPQQELASLQLTWISKSWKTSLGKKKNPASCCFHWGM